MSAKKKPDFYTTLSVTINGKTHFKTFDLTPESIKGEQLTEKQYNKYVECLILFMVEVLRDHDKVIETSQFKEAYGCSENNLAYKQSIKERNYVRTRRKSSAGDKNHNR